MTPHVQHRAQGPHDAAPAAPLVLPAVLPAGSEPMPDLLGSVLGPGGLVARPGVSHAELVATACDLVRQLLAIDECWLQDAGPLADVVATAARGHGGAWLVNPGVPAPAGGAAPRSHGAVGGAPVEVYGEVSALMVFSPTPRAWSARDLAVLVRAAGLLGEALEATLGQQLSPDQVARARYDDLRRELLTVLNHELRTPLAGLTAGLELLEDLVGDDVPAVAAVVRRIQGNAARLVAMTDDITILGDVATSESRVAATRFSPPDAVTVVAAAVGGRAARAAGRQVRLEMDPVDGPLPVAVPADDLREAVDRVLDNAVKFTDPGGRVHVSIAARTAQLVVTISDTGIGVPEDEHHRIGQPFFRATNARTLEKQGPGLGLAAAGTVLRAWGGSVRLDSTEGRGTTVRLVLPRAEPPRPS